MTSNNKRYAITVEWYRSLSQMNDVHARPYKVVRVKGDPMTYAEASRARDVMPTRGLMGVRRVNKIVEIVED